MVRGMYIAGTGMLLQRRKMETITNNIANVDTTGYKSENLTSHSFNEELVRRINDSRGSTGTYNTGPLRFGTQVDQLYIDFTTGSFEETGRATDLAIAGDGFFVMETPNGERYSRSGAFVLNVDGYLTDGDGNYLLGENGRIYVGTNDFAVDTNGNVTVDGVFADRIRIVNFEDLETLRKQGSNLYFSEAQPIEDAGGYSIQQGFLESSNVEVGREMVDMISVFRVYETNQRILTMIDETLGKAVNDIGRLR